MTRAWPSRDRIGYAYRLIETGVACPEPGCGEVYLPSGIAAHRLLAHGVKPAPRKPRKR